MKLRSILRPFASNIDASLQIQVESIIIRVKYVPLIRCNFFPSFYRWKCVLWCKETSSFQIFKKKINLQRKYGKKGWFQFQYWLRWHVQTKRVRIENYAYDCYHYYCVTDNLRTMQCTLYNLPTYLLCGNKGCCFSSGYTLFFLHIFRIAPEKKQIGREKHAIEGVKSSHLFFLFSILCTK